MRRGFDFTQIGNKEMIMTKGTNERMGGRPQAQDNKSKQDNQWKLIQAKKALEMRDRVLTAAIRRCHVELAKKESFWDIEASKDAVEAAWKEFNHANSRYCVYAGWDPLEKDNTSDKQPEEVRRAGYEWKVLTDMMEQVVDKAEEYLESATKENSRDELCEDEDGGNELDAEVEIQRWVEQLSTMSKVNEMALEVFAANEMNANEVNDVNKVNEVSNVNKVNEVNVSEVNVSEVNVSKVNVNAEEVKFDVKVEAKVEVFGMKEVKNLKDDNKVEMFDAKVGLRLYDKKAEVKQSRSANWDPGELVNAKEEIEMLDVEEVANLMNDDKVARSGDVKAMMFVYALYNWMLYTSDALVALCMARFVNSFSPLSVVEQSDYG